MKWWIEDGQIVGKAIEEMVKPDNWIEIEGAEADDRSQVYFDGETVCLIPPQPSLQHWWNHEQKQWSAPTSIAIDAPPDWDALVNWIRGSIYFERCYVAAKLTTGASAAATLLLVTLNQSHNLQDLAFVLADLLEEIEAIAAQGLIEAFTQAEKQILADKLNELRFPASIGAALVGGSQ